MKVLVHDEAFAASLHKLPKLNSSDELRLGAVIGIPGPKQAVLAHIALTPPEKSSEQLESCAAHAKQVSRMLPGGVDVLGVVAFCTPVVFEKQKHLVRQALSAVHRTLETTHQLQEYPQRTVLHIDPNSFKLTSRLFDTSYIAGNGTPQDTKQVAGQSLQKQLAQCLSFIEKAVSNGEVLIEGQRVAPESPLSSVGSNKGDLRVQFAVKQAKPSPSSAISLSPCGAQVSVLGGVQLRAIVPPRASCADAIEAIRQDAVRNLHSRCGMHCEDLLVIEDEQSDLSITHELPKRVFLRSSYCPSTVPFCDFLLSGDDPSDCLQAFFEILGLEVKPEFIEKNCERTPEGDIQDFRNAAQVEEMVEDIICERAKQLEKDPSTIIKFGLSFSVVVLAMLVAYILLVRH